VKLKLKPFQKKFKEGEQEILCKSQEPPKLENTMIPLFHNGKTTRIKYRTIDPMMPLRAFPLFC
jgi:hypothetical protein